LKNIFVVFCAALCACFLMPVAAEEIPGEPWGLRAGIDVGSIEHAQTNVRSLAIIPNGLFERSIDEFDLYANMELYFDLYAPDPQYDTGRDATVSLLSSMYAEEEAAYNLRLINYTAVPGTIRFSLNFKNNAVFSPDLWEQKENSNPPAFNTLNKLDGSLTPAIQYAHEFFWGSLYNRYGIPLKYASFSQEGLGVPDPYIGNVREGMQTDNGVGLETLIGYTDAYDLGLRAELSFSFVFSPDTKYAQTGLFFSYTKKAFSAAADVKAGEKFNRWTIGLEANHHIDPLTLKIAWTFDNIGKDPLTGEKLDPVFLPRIGMAWNL
jgi:hypothetical protein